MADTHRVKAFRNAAQVAQQVGTDELAARHVAGTLVELPGIGPRTAEVIGQALEGAVPDYLAELEVQAGPLAPGGEAVRGALRGDLHSHSSWSDGGSPIEEMALTAVEVGHEYLAVTDHSPRLRVARGLSAERLAEQIEVVARVEEAAPGLRLLSGVEVDILDDGSLDQSEEMLGRVDVVVASVHGRLSMEAAAMTRRLVAAVSHPRVAVLGHCTGRYVVRREGQKPREPSRFDAGAVFEACAEAGVAVEINCRPERVDPPDELIGVALSAGCLFAIDSDAHAPGQLDFLDLGCARAAGLGVPVASIVNSWPVDRLEEWLWRGR